MKGLLLKDAYQIWHYAKGVIVAAVVMMGAGVVTIMNGANFFIVYAGFFLGMMPMTLLAYDQASKFSEYSAVLPVTKEQLVGSKYIIGLCGLVLAEAFAAAALGVASLHWTAVDRALVVSTAGAGRHDHPARQHHPAAAELPLRLRKGKICVLSCGRPGCGSDGVWRVRQ